MRDDKGGGAAAPARLQAVVRVGEGVRQVVEIAREVNLVALNAKLHSRRAGEAAVGFGVAAAEMRSIALALSDTMGLMSGLMAAMASGVARRMRRVKAQRLAGEAAARHPAVADAIGAVLHRGAATLERFDAELARQRHELGGLVARARRLCGTAQALARCASVEAAYGGRAAAALKQVAQDLAVTLGIAGGCLDDIDRALQESLR